MRIRDWSSDVCSSDLRPLAADGEADLAGALDGGVVDGHEQRVREQPADGRVGAGRRLAGVLDLRAEEGRVGKGCVSRGGSRWLRYDYTKKLTDCTHKQVKMF